MPKRVLKSASTGPGFEKISSVDPKLSFFALGAGI